MTAYTYRETVLVKASDVLPYFHGMWVTMDDVNNGEPFVMEIVAKRWHLNRRVVFMFESHNFLTKPMDELIEVVPLESKIPESLRDDLAKREHEFQTARPMEDACTEACANAVCRTL